MGMTSGQHRSVSLLHDYNIADNLWETQGVVIQQFFKDRYIYISFFELLFFNITILRFCFMQIIDPAERKEKEREGHVCVAFIGSKD